MIPRFAASCKGLSIVSAPLSTTTTDNYNTIAGLLTIIGRNQAYFTSTLGFPPAIFILS